MTNLLLATIKLWSTPTNCIQCTMQVCVISIKDNLSSPLTIDAELCLLPGKMVTTSYSSSSRYHPGADPGFWKGGGPTMKDSDMSRWSRRGDAEGVAGGVWKGVKRPLAGGSGGASPRKFSTLWCFLLQSRHSSALLPGLLIQAY